MYEKILVTLDGSTAAEMVIPYAEEMAARLGSQMIIVSVSEPGAAGTERLYQGYLDSTAQTAQRDINAWMPRKEAKVQSAVLGGKVADEILRFADQNNVGLIAMTSRGSSGRGPWLLGSIAAKVLRATNTPLLLVRAPASESAIEQKRLIRRILVPLDGSELGAAAIPYAEALGVALDADLVLLHVLQPAVFLTPAAGAVPYAQPLADDRANAQAIEYLKGVREPLKQRGLRVSCAVVVGSPADKIIDYAHENAIDLIAMSSHGRSGFGRWVFGSVADKVLHAGEAPVLVVRGPRV